MLSVSVTFSARAGSIPGALFEECAAVVVRGERLRDLAISFVLVDDDVISRLNRRFLGHRGATDVITFSLGSATALEGEAYLSVPTARRNAIAYGVPLRMELARLAIHAILHLCGYNDGDEPAREAMKRAEDRHLATWIRHRHEMLT